MKIDQPTLRDRERKRTSFNSNLVEALVNPKSTSKK